MADEQSNERKISVSFSRKVSDGNYGTMEATAWVQGDAPEDATAGNISNLLGDLFAAAKVAVLDQLGIAYEFDTDSGIVRENVRLGRSSLISRRLWLVVPRVMARMASRRLGGLPVTRVLPSRSWQMGGEQVGMLSPFLLSEFKLKHERGWYGVREDSTVVRTGD